MPVSAPRVFLVAGEPSGDALGGGLIGALRNAASDAICCGVGGPRMVEAGMDLVFPYDDLAIMGLVEVLPRYFRIRRRWQQVMAAITAFDPDVVVTIDSSGFNKPIARRLIADGSTARRVHYVAPMVWAWRPGRAKKMANLFHHLLVLFPFEPPYFTAHGLRTTYVGHPATQASPGDGAAFRTAHDIPPDAPLLAILPGSRKTELDRLLPVFEAALEQIAAAIPELHLVFPTIPLVEARVRHTAAKLAIPAVVTSSPAANADAFAAANGALAASGTITLELALAKVPMAVAYKVNPLTAAVGRRLLNVTSASLPNVLSGRQLVPELLQEQCTPETIAQTVIPLLTDPTKQRAQIDGFEGIARALRTADGSPSDAAAAMVLEEAAVRRAALVAHPMTTPTE
jgi:lipid-A-disaccharide synthase